MTLKAVFWLSLFVPLFRQTITIKTIAEAAMIAVILLWFSSQRFIQFLLCTGLRLVMVLMKRKYRSVLLCPGLQVLFANRVLRLYENIWPGNKTTLPPSKPTRHRLPQLVCLSPLCSRLPQGGFLLPPSSGSVVVIERILQRPQY